MDKIIDHLYQIELDADKSLDTINEKKVTLKNKYDDKRTKYQKEAEKKFEEQITQIKKSYRKEEQEQLDIIENEFEIKSERIRKVFNHEQEHYVEIFMNEAKKLGVIENE